MNVVYKYPLLPGASSSRQMPQGAQLLSVGIQGEMDSDYPVVWARVDTSKPTVHRRILVIPTGTGMDFFDDVDSAVFVGTLQFPNGLVFHVFDYGEDDR